MYKKGLITTKSVDFNVPLQHSVNKRGFVLKNMKPKNNKLYNNSIKNEIYKWQQINKKSIKKNKKIEE